MIRIDGSYGEGGGQILRTSIALSALLGTPVEIYNIRAGRPNPGLQPQHLAGVQAAAALTDAELEGAHRGSTRLVFRPRKVRCGHMRLDVGTAGSISLVIQTLMPLLAHAPCPTRLEIAGGTDVAWSPPIDYMRLVALPVLARFGVEARLEVVRRGHYPRGGGLATLEVRPAAGGLRPLTALNFGRLAKVGGVSHAVNLPRHVAERQAAAAREALAGLGAPVDISLDWRQDGLGPGSGLVLYALSDSGHVLGGDSLGERGKPAEQVGREAAERLLAELRAGAAVDSHMADMAVVYMALAEGESAIATSRPTSHLTTNIHVVEQFLHVKFSVEGEAPTVIRVRGVGRP